MTNYTEQANKFLKDCNAKLEIIYKGRDKYFYDDEISRNVYICKLKRKGKQYTFNFVQSIAGTREGRKPTAYDILACLTKCEPYGDVWDFASEFGYEINSRESFNKVSKIYKEVLREWKGVNRLFGDVLEELREIQ